MRLIFATLALAVIALACGGTAPRKLNLYPSPTPNPTQTPYVKEVTTTPENTTTPVVIVVTLEPSSHLCVDASVAVHLRPSPSNENYPITVLVNKTVLEDTGSRKENWAFVRYGELSGWVNTKYVIACNKTQE